MEKNKMINVYIIVLMFSVALIFIVIAAIKVRGEHVDNLYLVVEKRIKEAAKDCFLNEDCEGQITLKDLYDKEYLDIQIDPVTKENMNEDLCLEYIEEKIEYCEVEE